MNREKYRLLCQTEEGLSLFSRDWWLDIVCGEANWDALFIEEKGNVQAVLPYYTPHKGIISMPPYTQTMGPWYAPEAADAKYTTVLGYRQMLCKKMLESLKKYPHFLQNFNYEITDWLPFYWEGYRQTTRYTYILRNITDSSALWKQMSPHTRRNINKAGKQYKITVRTDMSAEDFLRIQSLTFKRQHKRNKQDPDVLRRLIRVARERNQGELFGGYDEKGRLHAAVFIVWQKSSAYYIAGGGDPEFRASGAHSLVMWEAIRRVSEYTDTFDFEGSMLPGVERFFREFGGIQTPFHTITKGKISLLYRVWLKLEKRLWKKRFAT
ncbi:GNAT family N-acetyltransferase [Parabacteroides sp. Marseille-P3160]|uniref:GNAT family N-acetyltransferase n=1 Tax=Parabacteroides sp. Marseille-P3160 TaxID=1917887 RepID=UPI0009BA9AE4|nr:GNAT family N-acetyltransferase [Parabacteroides sp. Marseille-P3160]